MCPVTEIFGFSISTYSLLIIIGFVLGIVVAIFRRKVNGMRVDDLITCLMITAVGALLGAKLFFMAQGFPDFLARARDTGYTFFEYFSSAGLVYYGGFIGGILFLLLGAKVTGVSVWPLMDTALPSVPLMHAVGRLGCLSAGCCFGVPSEIGFYFDASPFAPHGVKLLPVQLIESLCLFALFFFHGLLRQEKKRTRKGSLHLSRCLRDHPFCPRVFPL